MAQRITPDLETRILAAPECRVVNHRRPGATVAELGDAVLLIGYCREGSAKFTGFADNGTALFSWK